MWFQLAKDMSCIVLSCIVKRVTLITASNSLLHLLIASWFQCSRMMDHTQNFATYYDTNKLQVIIKFTL